MEEVLEPAVEAMEVGEVMEVMEVTMLPAKVLVRAQARIQDFTQGAARF